MQRILFSAVFWAVAGVCAAQNIGGTVVFVSPMGQPYRGTAEQPSPFIGWFTRTDADADGRMTFEEFADNAARYFDTLDRNQDGFITSVESQQYWQREAPELFLDRSNPRGARRDPELGDDPVYNEILRRMNIRNRRGPPNEPPRGAQGFGMLNDVEPVMSCDHTFDRRVDIEEYAHCARTRFATIDRNSDGAFEKSEAPPPAPADSASR
jgi:hypothetical protein